MKSRMVSYTLETLPTISDERLEEMKRLAARPEEEINYSDAPALTEPQARHAFPGALRRFFRSHLMTRVDEDILTWLRAKGVDHDLFVNDLLRREMAKEKADQKHAA